MNTGKRRERGVEPIKPTKIEGHIAFCPCAALVEIPRFRTMDDVKRLPKDVRARLAIVAVNGGAPEVATIRCENCIVILDVRRS
jgi:hypothetical protein